MSALDFNATARGFLAFVGGEADTFGSGLHRATHVRECAACSYR